MALGNLPLSACQAFDLNGDERVAVNELVAAVGAALNGCAPLPTPTARAGLISIDGDPSDWAGIAPLITDPAGNGPPEVPVDVVALSVTNDEARVYFLLELAEVPGGRRLRLLVRAPAPRY